MRVTGQRNDHDRSHARCTCLQNPRSQMSKGVCQLNQEEREFILEGGDGIYHLSWPQLNVEARVDRIRESHDHEVRAEVLLVSSRPTSSGHLRQGRIILTSPTSRKTLAKSLSERDPEVDWDKVTEQLCIAVLQDFRMGSPVVQIDGQTDLSVQAKWLIEPLVQLRNPTLIYGPGSTGKSWFGQYIAVLADAGLSHGGFEVEPSTVLYLDWETDQIEIGSRVTMLRRGLGLEGQSHIWYKAMNSGLSNDIEAIRSVVVEKSIDLIIVDSIGSACMGEPESAEVVLRTFNSLRSLGVSSVCIDHTNKEGVLFGSVYKYNSARQVFEAKKDQQPDDNKIMLGLFHRKANNSKLRKDMGFEIGFGEEGNVTITRREVRDTALSVNLPVLDRISNALRRGALTVEQLLDELYDPDEKKTISESHLRKELSIGASKGIISKMRERNREGKQLYGIPAKEQTEWRI